MVIDSANLSQNVMTAARELQQVTNQIQQLQNEATMLENMGRNLSNLNFNSLSQITADLNQIGTLMGRPRASAFNVSAVQTAYQQRYPQQYATGTGLPQLLTDSRPGGRTPIAAISRPCWCNPRSPRWCRPIPPNATALVTVSQGAGGNLQVTQATNQLLALVIKEEIKLQTLLVAQGRSQALNGANTAQSEQEGRAAFATFIGSNSAYSPN